MPQVHTYIHIHTHTNDALSSIDRHDLIGLTFYNASAQLVLLESITYRLVHGERSRGRHCYEDGNRGQSPPNVAISRRELSRTRGIRGDEDGADDERTEILQVLQSSTATNDSLPHESPVNALINR